MAKYHIRTLTSHFDFNAGNGGAYGYSEDNVLENYNEPLLETPTYGVRMRPGVAFKTINQELYSMERKESADNYRERPPSKPAIDLDDLTHTIGSDGYVYYSNRQCLAGQAGGYLDQGWGAGN